MLFDRMNERMVHAMIERLPVEVTIIDAKDEVVGWNKNEERIFKRPQTAMGMNFRDCHPKESIDKVVKIVDEMRAGTRDKARFWLDLPIGPNGAKRKVLIEFFALRDYDGTYLGCMEASQDIQDFRDLQGSWRIGDEVKG